ncbi:hypothetical protein BKA81DRAFT_374695 [Phyllosticta paracitricarpa]
MEVVGLNSFQVGTFKDDGLVGVRYEMMQRWLDVRNQGKPTAFDTANSRETAQAQVSTDCQHIHLAHSPCAPIPRGSQRLRDQLLCRPLVNHERCIFGFMGFEHRHCSHGGRLVLANSVGASFANAIGLVREKANAPGAYYQHPRSVYYILSASNQELYDSRRLPSKVKTIGHSVSRSPHRDSGSHW